MSFYKVGQEFKTKSGKTVIVTKVDTDQVDEFYHLSFLDDLNVYYSNTSGFVIDEITLCTRVINGEWEPIDSSIKGFKSIKECDCDGHTLLWHGCNCGASKGGI